MMTQSIPDSPAARPTSRAWAWIVVTWAIAFLIALAVDAPVATWAHDSGTATAVKASAWAEAAKWPGSGYFAVPVVLLLLVVRQIRWKQAAFVLAALAISGVNGLLKWVVGRTRPFKLLDNGPLPRPFALQPFWHGIHGFFSQKDLSFPSGHECIAAAFAAALVVVWPRGAWVFVCLALAVGVERVLENAHYVSDVVGAIGFALLSVGLLQVALSPWMSRRAASPRGFDVVTAEQRAD